jgi:pimeloyl-ACP methyl ester carboxylesterase
MKRKLIFLHGGPGFRDYLRPYFHDLNDTFECVFYDQLRGPNITVDDLVSQLEEEVSDSMPVLVGHSWGGVLATEFALRHEKKVAGLALMSSGLSHTQWLEYRKNLQELGLSEAPLEEIVLAPEDPSSATEFLKKMDTTFSEETFDSLFETYLKHFDLIELLPLLSLKIAVVFGEKDLRFRPRIAEEILRRNPGVKSYPIEGAGHFPFLQKKTREKIFQVLRESFAGS